MQTHLVHKIMHQNFDLILRQLNYYKNSFIALFPSVIFLFFRYRNWWCECSNRSNIKVLLHFWFNRKSQSYRLVRMKVFFLQSLFWLAAVIAILGYLRSCVMYKLKRGHFPRACITPKIYALYQWYRHQLAMHESILEWEALFYWVILKQNNCVYQLKLGGCEWWKVWVKSSPIFSLKLPRKSTV